MPSPHGSRARWPIRRPAGDGRSHRAPRLTSRWEPSAQRTIPGQRRVEPPETIPMRMPTSARSGSAPRAPTPVVDTRGRRRPPTTGAPQHRRSGARGTAASDAGRARRRHPSYRTVSTIGERAPAPRRRAPDRTGARRRPRGSRSRAHRSAPPAPVPRRPRSASPVSCSASVWLGLTMGCTARSLRR